MMRQGRIGMRGPHEPERSALSPEHHASPADAGFMQLKVHLNTAHSPQAQFGPSAALDLL